MKINLLCENEQYINDVSRMIYNEFVVPTSSQMTDQEVFHFFSNTHSSQFPITFVAILDEQCVGTVSVFENDWKERPQYTPWLASLYVEPAYRSRKIGMQLIEAVIQQLDKLGYRELYLKTESTSQYYHSQGWELIESVLDENQETVDIFKYYI
ncbi:GNAT family N-acetyltransferase [Bacillus sp. REN10]|uniref:GNAT family N-acetyltransferase n=1 Tax=Bacillus sp. REN10 TaxID=2782541 RepID=UPI00193C077B|nr:GNAT family N-acetyltransferase [Bacillus sp. REN10]